MRLSTLSAIARVDVWKSTSRGAELPRLLQREQLNISEIDMVTRKAIEAAFELIVNDPDVVEVSYFIFKNGTPIDKVCHVNITRNMEFPDRYEVRLGLLPKGERKWFEERTELEEESPRYRIREWMYWKEKLAKKRRLAKVA